MKKHRFKKVILILLFTSPCLAAFSQQKIGIFDGHADIGANVKPGSATYIPQNDQYVISGAGYNIWLDHDEFHYVYKRMKGDFILYTRAEFVGWHGVEESPKSWMDGSKKP
ncbi:MAG: hypothetical protein WKG06_40905 [Segetibacter sp.]